MTVVYSSLSKRVEVRREEGAHFLLLPGHVAKPPPPHLTPPPSSIGFCVAVSNTRIINKIPAYSHPKDGLGSDRRKEGKVTTAGDDMGSMDEEHDRGPCLFL